MKADNLPATTALFLLKGYMIPKILVIGDAMHDHYWFAEATRLSAEAPIPVCKVTGVQSFPGGAANVEANLNVLGAETRLVSGSAGTSTPRGEWDEGDPIYPVKHRLIVGDTQVSRWDLHDEVDPIDLEELDCAVLHWKPNAVVISDYGKGSINEDVIRWLYIEKCVGKVPLFVDTKRSPAEFGCDGFTFFPNLIEYNQYKDEYDLSLDVVLKRSAEGIQHRRCGGVTREYPAWANQVVSVCGAGDTVIAAYTYASTIFGYEPLAFANAAAAVSVSKPWTSTASVKEINEVLKKVQTISAV